MSIRPIQEEFLEQICKKLGKMPFKVKGIYTNKAILKATLKVLNAEPSKMLPQNCKNDIVEKTPDGLDRRVKEVTGSNLRTANIVSMFWRKRVL